MSEIKQGYKQTKVGIIPEDWEVVKVGEVLKIGSGKDYKHLSTGNIPVYGTGGYMLSVNEYLHDGESVCIGRKGTIDKPMFLNEKFWTVDTLFYTHSFKKSLPKYIYLTFLNIDWQKYNEASGVPSLSKTTIETIQIPLPPLKEQEKIAEILTTWDKAITKQTELLRAKELLKIALMQKLLSGEVRFSGFSDEWEEVRIDKLFDFKKGQELSKEKLEKNGIFECILYGELYTTYSEVISEIKSKTNIKEGIKSKIDDILIPASTTTSAIDLAIASTIQKDNVLIGGDINILRKKTNNINGEFISKYLTHIKKMEIAKYAQGITIIHLYSKDFKHLKIQLPSLPEQQKIAEVLSLADDEINLLKNELEELNLQKKALMQKLLTGEVRVKV